MLQSRQVRASLLGEKVEVLAAKGCPQGGVLSPLLWDLVVDDLLTELNNKGLYTQGYADDLVVLIRGKHAHVISELMQQALNIIESWCNRENLMVNPNKTTMIPFTRRRKLEDIKLPKLFGTELQMSREVKYLGITLDAKLTWNSHLQNTINKSKMALMATKRAVGKNWGLNPRMVHWLYTTVVRPMILYGSVVWWTKIDQRKAELEMNKIQRLACLCITSAMRSTPTAAMETILNLPPLSILAKAEARMGAYRLACNNTWCFGPNTGQRVSIKRFHL